MRARKLKTNFSSGVLSPNAKGLADTELYASGLQIGRNISIETLGGIKRRPGTLFIRDYGSLLFIRIFPFTFNRDQTYIIVIVMENDSTIHMDIYRDNLLVIGDIVLPYVTEAQLKELDFAQSADSMVFSQGDFTPHVLRRLGSDDTWSFTPIVFVLPPPKWSDANGHPQQCTFHQGRLWFAATKTEPQSLWASVVQDFFNFTLGVGDDEESIQETLDTDFINPITAIYSARQLQVFTRGDEFTNNAKVMTPTSSEWVRQSNYGSVYSVPPVAVDGATLFVDSTGRTIRNFTYADERGGYDAPSVSAHADHLVKEPQRMGVLRGSSLDPANFVYVVNVDGTMAVLNISKAHNLAAWFEWTTQGKYRDIVTVNRDVFILVERFVDSSGVYVTYEGEIVDYVGEAVWYGSGEPGQVSSRWFLELISESMVVDSGAVEESISETTLDKLLRSEFNFFGVYFAPDGRGKVIIKTADKVIVHNDYLKHEPLEPFTDLDNKRYSPGKLFSYNAHIREQYYDVEFGYQWYMYTLHVVQTEDVGINYIDGLTHLIGSEVVSNLDGNVEDPQTVRVYDGAEDALIKSYPDGSEWLYDSVTRAMFRYAEGQLLLVEIKYAGATYTNPTETVYGYLILGETGIENSEYIEVGGIRFTEVIEEDGVPEVPAIPGDPAIDPIPGDVTVDYSGVSSGDASTISGSGGSFTFTVPDNVTLLTYSLIGAGGGGAVSAYDNILADGAGYAGSDSCGHSVAVTPGQQMTLIAGKPGASKTRNFEGSENGGDGTQSSFSGVVEQGGLGGIGTQDGGLLLYQGRGNSRTTCKGTFTDGSQSLIGGWGGQAGWADGGNGIADPSATIVAESGTIGSGGGAATLGEDNGSYTATSGAGGEGRVEITWISDYVPEGPETPAIPAIPGRLVTYDYHEVIRVKLIQGGIEHGDGYVIFPDKPFKFGQAGLFYPVIAQTMPLNVSSGAGSLVNEPKRIVSTTVRYKDTQGVLVNGVEVPERTFSDEVLDYAPPLLTGIDKIRHLGYNRDTTVIVTQNDPMPFTLLQIDIELNY